MVELVAFLPLVKDAVHGRNLERHAGGDEVWVVLQHTEIGPQDALGFERVVLGQAEKRVARFHLDLGDAFARVLRDDGVGIGAARYGVITRGGGVLGQRGRRGSFGRGAPDAPKVSQQRAAAEILVNGEAGNGQHQQGQHPGGNHQPQWGGASFGRGFALIGRFFGK